MSRLYFLFFMLCIASFANAQVSFSDNFDSYTPGDYLGVASTKWTTWTNKPGTDEDVIITSEKSLSPNNSIKIATTNPAGGPMDVILPFGARYTTGNFVYKMSMFIPKDRTAYFNFQGTTTPGTTWSLDVAFTESGLMQAFNGASILMREQYPVDQWFEIEVNVNLSSNIWKILIDGECKGAFATAVSAIASIDLYPTSDLTEYYVDNVSFSHDPAVTGFALDGGISEIVWSKGRLVGSIDKPAFVLRNNGTTNITSADIIVSRPGLSDTTLLLTGFNLAKNAKKTFNLPNVTLKGGNNKVEARLAKINGTSTDGEDCNNRTSFIFDAVEPAPFKAVLVEEATGTWCPWCPRGAVFMDLLSGYYPGRFIPIAMHGGSATEPMRLAEYESFLQFGGFPTVRVNRLTNADTDINPASAEEPFLQEIQQPTFATLTTGARFDQASKRLEISVDVDFIENASGNYYVSLVMTEDGVKGTTAAYNQANAYAGGTNGPMGGFETKANPVPAAQMVYDHVARAVSGLEPNGSNEISGVFAKGDKRTLYFDVTVPATWKTANMHIIPIMLENGAGYINCSSTTYAKAITNGYFSGTEDTFAGTMQMFPNPTSDNTNITFNLDKASTVKVELMSINGSVILSQDHGTHSGNVSINVPTSSLETGIYMVKVITAYGSMYQKLVKE